MAHLAKNKIDVYFNPLTNRIYLIQKRKKAFYISGEGIDNFLPLSVDYFPSWFIKLGTL